MTKSAKSFTGIRKHILPDRMKALAARAIAQKVGYLRVDDLPGSSIFAALPKRAYNPKRIIRCEGMLCLISGGTVQIRHSLHDYLVAELTTGVLFGDMPKLGQTMLGTEAWAGLDGALITIMNAAAANEWIKANPIAIVEQLGLRLAQIETEHYRARFQLADSVIAATLLDLAGEGSTIEGLTHEELGEKIGVYRETVTTILNAMKLDNYIEIDRKKITILNKRALHELSKL